MNHPPRIVFMGTSGFALGVLQLLLRKRYTVAGVVSAPDKPAGRGLRMQSSEVAAYARAHGLPLAQPVLLQDSVFGDQLRAWNADLFVVVAFRMLPEAVWQLPRLGTFNVHASLLPQYRGAAPVNWALIRGETTTGVTTFLIDSQIDMGNILFQESLAVLPHDTAGSLHDRLMALGADLACRTIDALAAGTVQPVPQPRIQPLHGAPKLNKELCRIQWDNSPQQICNLIRGLSPHPAAFSLLHTSVRKQLGPVPVKIFTAHPVAKSHHLPVGAILSDHKSYLYVACRGGYVSLTDIQAAGKKRMPVKDFLLGLRNSEEALFA